MSHRHELIKFQGHDGELSATLQIPDGPVKGGIVQAHCFTCSRSLKVTRYLASGIEAGGYAVLRFDFTGLGESEGEFEETSVTTNIQDLARAAEYMEQRAFGPCAMVRTGSGPRCAQRSQRSDVRTPAGGAGPRHHARPVRRALRRR